jgi:hypothetical protein
VVQPGSSPSQVCTDPAHLRLGDHGLGGDRAEQLARVKECLRTLGHSGGLPLESKARLSSAPCFVGGWRDISDGGFGTPRYVPAAQGFELGAADPRTPWHLSNQSTTEPGPRSRQISARISAAPQKSGVPSWTSFMPSSIGSDGRMRIWFH